MEVVLDTAIGGSGIDFSYSWVVNKWQHVVIAQSDSEVSAYVDGALINSVARVGTPFEFSYIGRDDATYGNGYLSDVYFVDGEALEPETFGRSYRRQVGTT